MDYTCDSDGQEISRSEIIHSINLLNDGKAVGPDEVPAVVKIY